MTEGVTEPPVQPFIATKEYRRFVEFCEACRRDRYIGLCYGPPGVGKTLSARHYARWDQIEATFPWCREGPPVPPELALCRVGFCTAPVTGTPRNLSHMLNGACRWLERAVDTALEAQASETEPEDLALWQRRSWLELLIVDEADRLKMSGLEEVRDYYDHRQMGLVLIGMPGIEKRLARYPQLYSRVGFVHHFRPLSEAEVRHLLVQQWAQLGLPAEVTEFTDVEALAAIIRITNGNFRLLNRLFAQIDRVLQINALATVTKEVVETARENLVIGVL